MKSAVVQNGTNIVINMILADPSVDPSPEPDCYLVLIPDDVPVDFGWIYDPELNVFYQP